MKALRILCIVPLLGLLLAIPAPVAADEEIGTVTEDKVEITDVPQGDVVHFVPIIGDIPSGIQVTNMGTTSTFVDVWYYAPNGANIALETRSIDGQASSTFYPLPAVISSVSSAVVVSYRSKVNPGHPADRLGDRCTFPDTGYNYKWSCPIATTVNRFGSGGRPAGTYTGVGLHLLPRDEADGVPYWGGDTFWIYVPLYHLNNSGWNSNVWLQHAYLGNLFGRCGPMTPVSVNYYFYATNGNLVVQGSASIPPFGSIMLTPPSEFPAGTYSVWVRANGLIAGVVDEFNSPTLTSNTRILMTYRASPRNRLLGGRSSANFNFGPLIFSQYNGWESGIVVLNTSGSLDATVAITFRDTDGTLLHEISATLEERSSQIVYPLSVIGLQTDRVGSVTIEAQNFQPPSPFNAIVAVVNQFNPAESKGSAYNAFRAVYNRGMGEWLGLDASIRYSAPLVMRYNGGTTLTTGWSTGLVLMNTATVGVGTAEPYRIDFFDVAGGPAPFTSISLNLGSGVTHPIDCRYFAAGLMPAGWVGSAAAWSVEFNDPCALVVNELFDPPTWGDFFMTYEGYPY